MKAAVEILRFCHRGSCYSRPIRHNVPINRLIGRELASQIPIDVTSNIVPKEFQSKADKHRDSHPRHPAHHETVWKSESQRRMVGKLAIYFETATHSTVLISRKADSLFLKSLIVQVSRSRLFIIGQSLRRLRRRL